MPRVEGLGKHATMGRRTEHGAIDISHELHYLRSGAMSSVPGPRRYFARWLASREPPSLARSMAAAPLAFDPQVVAAVCRHLNDDHGADTLLIARTLGAIADADCATAIDIDGGGLTLTATTSRGQEQTRVPFADPVRDRAGLRAAVVALHQRACLVAGIPGRAGEGEHS